MHTYTQAHTCNHTYTLTHTCMLIHTYEHSYICTQTHTMYLEQTVNRSVNFVSFILYQQTRA